MRATIASLLVGAAMLGACGAPDSTPTTVAVSPAPSNVVRVPMQERGGTPVVMVGISKTCCFPFIVDSGAADVTVSPMVFRAMVGDGLVTQADLVGVQTYRLADGKVIQGLRFRMPPMTVGGHTVHGVIGSVSPGSRDDVLLLGQSFLKKFRGWSIDNHTGELALGL